MTYKANHSIVVGKGADAKTIAAGEPLPSDLSKSEIDRLREIGAIGSSAPSPGTDTAIEQTAGAPAQTGKGAPADTVAAERAARERKEAEDAAAAKKAAEEEAARKAVEKKPKT